jgi:hypothetical protein
MGACAIDRAGSICGTIHRARAVCARGATAAHHAGIIHAADAADAATICRPCADGSAIAAAVGTGPDAATRSHAQPFAGALRAAVVCAAAASRSDHRSTTHRQWLLASTMADGHPRSAYVGI